MLNPLIKFLYISNIIFRKNGKSFIYFDNFSVVPKYNAN